MSAPRNARILGSYTLQRFLLAFVYARAWQCIANTMFTILSIVGYIMHSSSVVFYILDV
jgi:hypothetical protein